MVTLDKTFNQDRVEYLQYRSQRTDSNGKFAFTNLGNGEYRLTVYTLGYQKMEFIHRLVAASDEVQITLQANIK